MIILGLYYCCRNYATELDMSIKNVLKRSLSPNSNHWTLVANNYIIDVIF